MTQDAITEFGMNVFSRRIAPYLSWLESRIESGWEQSEQVSRNVLKEVKELSTSMRAKFILGVPKNEFANEILQTIELFELAADAFPYESDEIEAKVLHFCKGIAQEIGIEFLPKEQQTQLNNVQQVSEEVAVKPNLKQKPNAQDLLDGPQISVDIPEEVVIKVEKPKVTIKKEKATVKKNAKVNKKQVKEKISVKPVEQLKSNSSNKKKDHSKKQKKKQKGFIVVNWLNKIRFG
ncbi:hypothetical protein COV18_06135 [Candidatus Woesearchaeota archaeon CG10_big_fil_rev_8_21_14_0_10_37_12]|nr:MAG: hypothetical protein COV18_06135 [Candidatus Woesearchaeota archaeon CG10_big_fil_rev_8_21_14_0_10_37_12]